MKAMERSGGLDRLLRLHPWPWRALPGLSDEVSVFDGKGNEVISGDDLEFWRGIADAVNLAAFKVMA